MAKEAQTSKNWIDIKALKRRVTLKMVLDHYGVGLKQSGKGWVAPCPIHRGNNPRAFSADLEKSIWNCFTRCGQGGNVVDFVAMKEFGDKEPSNIFRAAKMLTGWFPSTAIATADKPLDEDRDRPASTAQKRGKPSSAEATEDQPASARLQRDKPERESAGNQEEPSPENADGQDKSDTAMVSQDESTSATLRRDKLVTKKRGNRPLGYELKNLDPEHPWFEGRGITVETAKTFGAGYKTTGKFIRHRIAIPIHDENSVLLGYCGRAIDDEQAEEGKYIQPPGFQKSLVLYNLNRVLPSADPLILVESYISVWWLYQNGFPNTVALQGSSLSEEQAELVAAHVAACSDKVIVLMDNDEAGERCRDECLLKLGQKMFVMAPDYAEFGSKPHQVGAKGLKRVLGNPTLLTMHHSFPQGFGICFFTGYRSGNGRTGNEHKTCSSYHEDPVCHCWRIAGSSRCCAHNHRNLRNHPGCSGIAVENIAVAS